MPEPHTTPGERDVPVFQPGKPTPEDPRKEAPIKDPPIDPEHDAGEGKEKVLYDESRAPG